MAKPQVAPVQPKKQPPALVILFAVFFLIMTVGLFSYWGYQWVNYLLSIAFNVKTQSTLFDLFAGLIGMISSVFLFVGSIKLLSMKLSSVNLLLTGASGFLVKNLLDIAIDINPLTQVDQVNTWQISQAAWSIGVEFLHIAFWIFVLVFFCRKSLKEQLS